MKNLLLHTCCIVCGAGVIRELESEYKITLYFYNPNIFPRAEYQRRLNETRKIADDWGYSLIEEAYNHEKWRALVAGHEKDLERGARCHICYRDRLEKTAQKTIELNFDCFATTLTISPHKDANAILEIGSNIADKATELSENNLRPCVQFIKRDFKKNDGYRKTTLLARELGLYRQEYCGCEFSRVLR